MNKRIKELMLEAGYAAPELAGRARKFAELIVRECVRIGQETSKEIFKMSKKEGDIFEYESHGAEQVVDNIKQHFGVEE
jgi:hypothetical protein